ncbi:hypothetical protein ONE63_011446 [Megalurothrips usitatus]|uniref:Uncharacterized protein n=1 Tax=Megalurothrips usitatus TaxID=439358 RepID=A0AAV7X2F1_9NEOP|nr:hypothetical protein ONE63_011446 [Megalurothrips usitatus]
MNPESNDPPGPPAKKKRGQYKQWLHDPSVPIPPSTIHSRNLAALRTAQKDDNAASTSQLDATEKETNVEDEDADEERCADNQADNPVDPDQQIQSETPEETSEKETARKDFIKKHHLTEKLCPQSHLSKLDVLLMILHMAVRHCHTQHFIEDQIKFVNTLFNSNVLDVSYYIFKTLFKPSVAIIKHYFCVDCDFYIGKDQDFVKPECPECHTFIDNSSSNFVVCPDCKCCIGSVEELIDQESVECPKCLKDVDINCTVPDGGAVCLNCKYFMDSKTKFLKRMKSSPCVKCNRPVNVNSIFAMEFYRKLMEPGGTLEDENALSVTFNTDGVVVQDSVQNDLYPIWLHINEVVPQQRFKQENLILGGIRFGKSAPNMSMFLEPFTSELVDLSVNGVKRTLPNGNQVICPVCPLMCSLDSVCKPKVVCQRQFNGRMACLYCYHPNDTTVPNVGKTQKFYDQEKVYDLRTDEEVIRDMMTADGLQQEGKLGQDSVNGFLGISVLLKFTDLLDSFSCNPFSIVWGVSIDYMHAALEGVTSDLFNIIANILTTDQLEMLNARLQEITPPQGMTRRPRSFTDRVYWKAKEFRAVLLYYILPCLDGILDDRYYANLKMFVNAMHILLSDAITPDQLAEASTCLDNFCVGYQRLYGMVNVSYNLHVCRHFAEQVKRYGGLWCFGNFVFESGNGYLLKLVRGTKSVANEIAVKHSAIKAATKVIAGNDVSDDAIKFCSTITKREYSKKSEEIGRAPMTSSQSSGKVSERETVMLRERNVNVSDNSVTYYNRVIRDGIVYCSKSYTKAKVYDDSCVQLENGHFVVIDKFVKCESDKLLCLVKPLRIAPRMDIINSIKRCVFDAFGPTEIVEFTSVKRKCFLVSYGMKNYVCLIPNFYERD